MQLVPWDKAEHFLAFYGLTGLAVAAFPRRNLFIVAALLSGFGAFIEYVQGLETVHRDRDFWDWVADTIAIAAACPDALGVVARSGRLRSEEHRHINLINRGIELVERLSARRVLRHPEILDIAEIEVVERDAAYVECGRRALEYLPSGRKA